MSNNGKPTPRWTSHLDAGFGEAHWQAYQRMEKTPAELTDEDIETIRFLQPAMAEKALAARTKATTIDSDAFLAEHGHKGVTYRWVFTTLIPVLKELKAAADARLQQFEAHTSKLQSELEAKDQRIAALELRPELTYCGVWRDDGRYDVGSMITHSGSLWLCTEATSAKPGTHGSWRLIVKAGRV